MTWLVGVGIYQLDGNLVQVRGALGVDVIRVNKCIKPHASAGADVIESATQYIVVVFLSYSHGYFLFL
jgi:hypothetical protein